MKQRQQGEGVRAAEIDLGMQRVSSLPEIMPDQADDKIRPIYEDIKNTFRVPVVNFFFRVLANYPSYLVSAWNEFGPYLRTIKLEGAADELRSAALLEPVPESLGTGWASLGELQKIRPFTDTIHYLLPKLLFVATAFHGGLRSGARASAGKPVDVEKIPYGVAEGTASIPMVDPAGASGELRAVFDDIKERHHHPEVATYYRSLGHWPTFLAAVWQKLKPIIGSPNYEQRKQAVLEQALRAVESCSPSRKRSAKEKTVSSSRELDDIRAICAVFRFRLVSDLLLDVSLIKAILDGPDAARSSRFSFQR